MDLRDSTIKDGIEYGHLYGFKYARPITKTRLQIEVMKLDNKRKSLMLELLSKKPRGS